MAATLERIFTVSQLLVKKARDSKLERRGPRPHIHFTVTFTDSCLRSITKVIKTDSSAGTSEEISFFSPSKYSEVSNSPKFKENGFNFHYKFRNHSKTIWEFSKVQEEPITGVVQVWKLMA